MVRWLMSQAPNFLLQQFIKSVFKYSIARTSADEAENHCLVSLQLLNNDSSLSAAAIELKFVLPSFYITHHSALYIHLFHLHQRLIIKGSQEQDVNKQDC